MTLSTTQYNALMAAIRDILDMTVLYEGTLTTSSVSVPADTTCGVAYAQNNTFRNCFLRITGGLATAALNQVSPIRLYTGTTGVFTLDHDLTALPGLVTYEILGLPSQADRLNQIQGGTTSLQDLANNDAAELDIAEVRTIASPVTLTANYQYIHTQSPGVPFYFAGGFVSQATGAWAGGESVTIVVEVMIDGTNWDDIWSLVITAALAPTTLAVPSHGTGLVATTLLNLPFGFYNNGGGVRVGIKQTVEGAGFGTWVHSFINAVRGT